MKKWLLLFLLLAAPAWGQDRYVYYRWDYKPLIATDSDLTTTSYGTVPYVSGCNRWMINVTQSTTGSYASGNRADSVQITLWATKAQLTGNAPATYVGLTEQLQDTWDSVLGFPIKPDSCIIENGASAFWPATRYLGDSANAILVRQVWPYDKIKIRIRSKMGTAWNTDSVYSPSPVFHIEFKGLRD